MTTPFITLVYGACFLLSGICVLGYLVYLAVRKRLRRRPK